MIVRRKFARAQSGNDLDADIAALDDQKLFNAHVRRCHAAHKRGQPPPELTDVLFFAYQRAVNRPPYWLDKIPSVVTNGFYRRLEKISADEGQSDNCRLVLRVVSAGTLITYHARTP